MCPPLARISKSSRSKVRRSCWNAVKEIRGLVDLFHQRGDRTRCTKRRWEGSISDKKHISNALGVLVLGTRRRLDRQQPMRASLLDSLEQRISYRQKYAHSPRRFQPCLGTGRHSSDIPSGVQQAVSLLARPASTTRYRRKSQVLWPETSHSIRVPSLC